MGGTRHEKVLYSIVKGQWRVRYVFGMAVAMGGAGVACAESNKSEGKVRLVIEFLNEESVVDVWYIRDDVDQSIAHNHTVI